MLFGNGYKLCDRISMASKKRFYGLSRQGLYLTTFVCCFHDDGLIIDDGCYNMQICWYGTKSSFSNTHKRCDASRAMSLRYTVNKDSLQ